MVLDASEIIGAKDAHGQAAIGASLLREWSQHSLLSGSFILLGSVCLCWGAFTFSRCPLLSKTEIEPVDLQGSFKL